MSDAADDSNDDATGDVSPDEYERRREYIDLCEQHSRHRVITNGGGRL